MTDEHLYAVIMAGGKGTRFWPASRESKPKQILAIAGPDPMIRATVDRILPKIPAARILVVTGAAHARDIRLALPDVPGENIVAEPVGRNTAPCIGLAAHMVLRLDPQGVMLVLPADHTIEHVDEFLNIVAHGAQLAQARDVLVTLGIHPTRPETGYGYIEAGPTTDRTGQTPGSHLPVLEFHEKPELEKALAYLATGRFYWNSGMFIWKAAVILEWIQQLLPDLARDLSGLAEHLGQPDFQKALEDCYPNLQSISIDYGVMEKAADVVVLPADIGWSDVGSWNAAADYWPRIDGNALEGQALFIDTTGCVVYSPNKTAALIGVRDLIVVDTPDALLICPKDRDQDVKKVVAALEKQGRRELL